MQTLLWPERIRCRLLDGAWQDLCRTVILCRWSTAERPSAGICELMAADLDGKRHLAQSVQRLVDFPALRANQTRKIPSSLPAIRPEVVRATGTPFSRSGVENTR
jgi:hypothetical protein